jgi:hypothetical protein
MRMTSQRQNDQPPNRERSRPSPLSRRRPPFLDVSGTDAAEAEFVVPTIVPRSDPETSDLWFREQVVRQRSRKAAPLEEALIAAFQRAGWVHGIPYPLNGAADPGDQTAAVVRRLNGSLELDWLRFHLFAKRVWWEDRAANAPVGTARLDAPADDTPSSNREIAPLHFT